MIAKVCLGIGLKRQKQIMETVSPPSVAVYIQDLIQFLTNRVITSGKGILGEETCWEIEETTREKFFIHFNGDVDHETALDAVELVKMWMDEASEYFTVHYGR